VTRKQFRQKKCDIYLHTTVSKSFYVVEDPRKAPDDKAMYLARQKDREDPMMEEVDSKKKGGNEQHD